MADYSAAIQNMVVQSGIDWTKLDGSRVFVTGSTGLIGSMCIKTLLELNAHANAGIRVCALVRNVSKAREAFSACSDDDALEFVQGDLAQADFTVPQVDYVIHAGCPTASNYFRDHPVETSKAIVGGTLHILDAARLMSGFRSMVYVSSMEVYGNGNHTRDEDKLKEVDLGLVDTMSVRSCYPMGKRMAENYCCTYASEYGVPTKVVRLAQTFGPGIAPNDGRVFAQFTRSAMNGEDIILRTTGASSRMYLHTLDAVSAIFTVLLNGEDGNAYSAANEETFSSVLEMAEMVAQKIAGGSIGVRVEVDPDAPYPPEHHLPLDTSKLQALGWSPAYGLEKMYEDLIAAFS